MVFYHGPITGSRHVPPAVLTVCQGHDFERIPMDIHVDGGESAPLCAFLWGDREQVMFPASTEAASDAPVRILEDDSRDESRWHLWLRREMPSEDWVRGFPDCGVLVVRDDGERQRAARTAALAWREAGIAIEMRKVEL